MVKGDSASGAAASELIRDRLHGVVGSVAGSAWHLLTTEQRSKRGTAPPQLPVFSF